MSVTAPDVVDIIALVERDLPGWNWGVRRVKPGEYAADIVSDDFDQVAMFGRVYIHGRRHSASSAKPAEAMARAYQAALAGLAS